MHTCTSKSRYIRLGSKLQLMWSSLAWACQSILDITGSYHSVLGSPARLSIERIIFIPCQTASLKPFLDSPMNHHSNHTRRTSPYVFWTHLQMIPFPNMNVSQDSLTSNDIIFCHVLIHTRRAGSKQKQYQVLFESIRGHTRGPMMLWYLWVYSSDKVYPAKRACCGVLKSLQFCMPNL